MSNGKCVQCGKPAASCDCVDVCHRCGQNWHKCLCQESTYPPRYPQQDPKSQPDEEREDDFRRDYLDEGEKSAAYYHGLNTVRKFGVRRTITWCKYSGQQRIDFFRGVSDARFRLS